MTEDMGEVMETEGEETGTGHERKGGRKGHTTKGRREKGKGI